MIKLLHDNKIKPTAMIDISDGLVPDLNHLAKQSNSGYNIYEKRLPIHKQTIETSPPLFFINLTTALELQKLPIITKGDFDDATTILEPLVVLERIILPSKLVLDISSGDEPKS